MRGSRGEPNYSVSYTTSWDTTDQLGALEDETFRTACKIVVGQDHHFPSVARLRELYRELLRQRATRLRVLPEGGERPDPGKVADLLARLRQAVKDA